MRFLARRMPGGMVMTPLAAKSRDDLRFRRTPRPLLSRLEEDAQPTIWGLRPARDEDAPFVASRNGQGLIHVDPEASRLIVLQLGSAQGRAGRRDGLLEVRDWMDGSEPLLTPQAEQARSLVERCARRIRRRGQLQNGHWHLPE